MTPNSIFITGANRGLGLGLVKYILSQSAQPKYLLAACRDPTKAEELQNLAKQHSCLKVITLDVTKDSDIDAAYKQTADCVGEEGLNLLINNAAIHAKPGGSLPEATRDKMQSHFNVNATAPILITQKFLPLLKTAAERNTSQPVGYQRAAVITLSTIMSSIHSVHSNGHCNSYHYRVSKAALNMVTTLMSVELKESGILVAAIHPGWVKTDMGGPSADLETKTSVMNVWSSVAKMTEKSAGLLHNYDGSVLPW